MSVAAPGSAPLLAGLRPPPGHVAAPVFDAGWRVDRDDAAAPFLSYLAGSEAVGWSADLEALHEGSSREHPIDVLTREAAVAALRGAGLGPAPALLDVGCSSGHLLGDLRAAWPGAALAGVDAEDAGLAGAHARVPDAALMHASATDLPLADGVVDGLVALNLLEHLPDDVAALAEFARVMRPGARAVVVVPSNPRLYDYYDAHLQHQRRYARGELAGKAGSVGLRRVGGFSLGSVVYPGFWLVKTRNRRLDPTPEEARERVEADIARSSRSPLARSAFRLEGALLRRGARPAHGTREVLVVERPA
jgi:SAM-dependent methyltransferase